MLGNSTSLSATYVLDSNAISEIFRSYYRCQFPSFWERFDELVLSQRVVSVRAVRSELEAGSRGVIAKSVAYLENLNGDFFHRPDDAEQMLVREMTNDPLLSAARNRWRSKVARGVEDADPYLVAMGRVTSPSCDFQVVTLESAGNPAGVPSVCGRFGVPCISLQQMMAALGWRF